ncbi:hypothetical protein N0B40_18530 [Chryseobacterium oranimense]|uniref:AbiTii domain-containing protein n=1 Tax=Chryseobacterium oranimense TaxID=421058 RepID=UPI0021AFB2B7|nr:hypothetical protein [Chryseobacterium oranimense]UWX60383.1 hypothetical protein N0B40_18530 [Chryseobacterium oranimense]
MNIKKLVESVIFQLANNESISSIVPKLQVIAKLLKNEEFKSWVHDEYINGYDEEINVPEYRNINIISIIASFIQHQGFGRIMQYSNCEVPIINLGVQKYNEITNITIRHTVLALDTILIENKGNIHLSLPQYEKILIQKKILQNCEISEIHKIIAREQLQYIISQSNAKLLDFFLELNETIFENEINFNIMENKDKISQIVNHTINTGVYVSDNSTANINDSTVQGGSNNKLEFSNEFKKKVLELTNKIEDLSKDLEVDREDIAFEIAQIKTQLQKGESSKFIKSSFNAIKGIASGIVSNVAADQITEVLNQTLPTINF